MLYAALLFYLSSLHHPSVPRFPFSDKVLHLLFYAGFGLIFTWACDPTTRGWSIRGILIAAGLGAIIYGMTDEFHQRFVTGRTSDLVDLSFDALGGFAGGILFLMFRKYVERSHRKGKAKGSDPALASF
jgi:VanZ family protein